MTKLTRKEMENWKHYHLPGCGNLNSVKVNAVFFRKANTKEHELKKAEVCWDILNTGMNFITEAERTENRERKIVDVVELATGREIEIVHKHESHEQVLSYRNRGVLVVICNPFTCEVCKQTYPVRNNKTICSNCEVK